MNDKHSVIEKAFKSVAAIPLLTQITFTSLEWSLLIPEYLPTVITLTCISAAEN